MAHGAHERFDGSIECADLGHEFLPKGAAEIFIAVGLQEEAAWPADDVGRVPDVDVVASD